MSGYEYCQRAAGFSSEDRESHLYGFAEDKDDKWYSYILFLGETLLSLSDAVVIGECQGGTLSA